MDFGVALSSLAFPRSRDSGEDACVGVWRVLFRE